MDLLFILACALANCLGGRFPKDPSQTIRPEHVFRGVVVGVLSGLYASTIGHSPFASLMIGAWIAVANGFWATFSWHSMFMAIHGRDERHDGRNQRVISFVNSITRSPSDVIMSTERAKLYGMVYGMLVGLRQMPLYIGLAAAFLNPWTLLIGLGCMLQGVCYRIPGFFRENVASVAYAELLEGALYGTLITLAI